MKHQTKMKRLKEKSPATYEFVLLIEAALAEGDPEITAIVEDARKDFEEWKKKNKK